MAIADTHMEALEPTRPSIATRGEFDLAVREQLPALFRYALARARDREEAEDLLQASLVRAWTHRAGFDGRGSLLGWLLAIIRSEHLERVRGSRRRFSLITTFAALVRDGFGRFTGVTADEVEQTIAGHIDAAVVRDAIRELPDLHRDVITLCDIEELPLEEVSAVLGVAVGTVKSRHHRARRELASILARKAGRP
jgi:RNA polymerase sigma-70 factor (ECF subfamily)